MVTRSAVRPAGASRWESPQLVAPPTSELRGAIAFNDSFSSPQVALDRAGDAVAIGRECVLVPAGNRASRTRCLIRAALRPN